MYNTPTQEIQDICAIIEDQVGTTTAGVLTFTIPHYIKDAFEWLDGFMIFEEWMTFYLGHKRHSFDNAYYDFIESSFDYDDEISPEIDNLLTHEKEVFIFEEVSRMEAVFNRWFETTPAIFRFNVAYGDLYRVVSLDNTGELFSLVYEADYSGFTKGFSSSIIKPHEINQQPNKWVANKSNVFRKTLADIVEPVIDISLFGDIYG